MKLWTTSLSNHKGTTVNNIWFSIDFPSYQLVLTTLIWLSHLGRDLQTCLVFYFLQTHTSKTADMLPNKKTVARCPKSDPVIQQDSNPWRLSIAPSSNHISYGKAIQFGCFECISSNANDHSNVKCRTKIVFLLKFILLLPPSNSKVLVDHCKGQWKPWLVIFMHSNDYDKAGGWFLDELNQIH